MYSQYSSVVGQPDASWRSSYQKDGASSMYSPSYVQSRDSQGSSYGAGTYSSQVGQPDASWRSSYQKDGASSMHSSSYIQSRDSQGSAYGAGTYSSQVGQPDASWKSSYQRGGADSMHSSSNIQSKDSQGSSYGTGTYSYREWGQPALSNSMVHNYGQSYDRLDNVSRQLSQPSSSHASLSSSSQRRSGGAFGPKIGSDSGVVSSVGGFQSYSDKMQSSSSTWPNTHSQLNLNQYQKKPLEQNSDDSEFMRVLQVRMAAELQDEQVEVGKILKVMNIVEKVKADIDKSRKPVSDQSISMPISSALSPPFGMSGMSNPRGIPPVAGMGAQGVMPQLQRGMSQQMGIPRTNEGFLTQPRFLSSSLNLGMPHQRFSQNIGNLRPNVGYDSRDFQRSPRGHKFGNRYRHNDRQEREQGRFMRKEEKSPGAKKGNYSQYSQGGKTNTVQPLKLPPNKRQANIMKLRLLAKFLKAAKPDDQPLNRLQSAMAKCNNAHKLGLKFNFDQGSYLGPESNQMMTFAANLDDIFLARANGKNLKSVKKECYTNVVEMLTKMSPEKILKKKDAKPKSADNVVASTTSSASADPSPITSTPAVLVKPKDLPNLLELHEYMNSLRTSSTDKKMSDSLEDAFLTLEIDYDYSVEEKKRASGAPWFIGVLKVDNVVIGTGSGPYKEKAKKKAYIKAHNVMKKRFQNAAMGIPIDEVKLLPGPELLTETHYNLPSKATEKNICNMMQKVSQMQQRGSQPSQMMIEEAAKKSDVVLMRVSKKKPGTPKRALHQCEIYLDNIFITVGEAWNQTDALKKAYEDTLVILCSSDSNVIYNDFKRVSTEDAVDVREVVEVTSSKNIRTVFFNQARKAMNRRRTILKAKGEEMSFNTSDISEIVIMENIIYSSQRYKKAIEILQSSAILNMMTFEGKVTDLGTNFKCDLFIQGERIISCVAPTKEQASTKAGAIALFRLYQTRPTITMVQYEDQDKWISFESLIPQAEELDVEIENMPDIVPADQHDTSDTVEKQHESMETGHPDATEEPQQEGAEDPKATTDGPAENSEETDGDTIMESGDDSKKKVRKRVLKVIEGMLKDFTQKARLDEISFGGGYEKPDLELIVKVARGIRLSAVHKRKDKQEYVLVYQTLEPKLIHEILTEMGGTCGKYSLTPMKDLPSSSDLKKYEQTDVPLVKPQAGGSQPGQSAPSTGNRKRRHSGGKQGQAIAKARNWNKKQKKQNSSWLYRGITT